MNTLISHHPEPQIFSKLPSFSSKNKKPIFIFHYKCLLNPQNTIYSSIRASCTTNSAAIYGGWDDYKIRVDSDKLGESNFFKKFLVSLGINDKKYVFTCILGFVCALAISRVRVSSIIVFPAAAIVFAIGFSFGFSANGKPHKDLGLNGAKTRVYVENLKGLVEIFDGFDVKINDLKNEMKNAIEFERVNFGDLETYVNAVETIGGLILNARSLVDDCIGVTLAEGQGVGKNPNQKNGRRKKETGHKGFDLFGLIGSIFKGSVNDLRSSRTNSVNRDILAKEILVQGQGDVEGASDTVSTVDGSIPYRETVSNGSRKKRVDSKDQETKRNFRRGETNTMDANMDSKSFLNADEYNYQNVRFSSNRRFSLNMSAHRDFRKWVSEDTMSSNVEFEFSKEHPENEGSLKNQRIFENSNRAYESSEGRGNNNFGHFRKSMREERLNEEDVNFGHFRKSMREERLNEEDVNFGRFRESMREEMMNEEDELYSRKYKHRAENDISSFSSSVVSDDLLFDKYLRKANNLLKEAKECLKAIDDEFLAEEMLNESAKLLCEAIALKPMSLLAIGQLGNTYLLHGELKLKVSRELRTLLSKGDNFRVERSKLFILEDTFPSKDGIENSLISECEECESLLVEAGRKYRMALSIDGNDVRALYNWGLALSFRAQLIADVGPEAALDADKLFLAAIDKFSAMMSRSNDYAPEDGVWPCSRGLACEQTTVEIR
ncbi:uncharacterized protein [Spinacia oleracea]|uniref:Uncharacterized protein isoform X2 n=1 Tax=Spinacia oleracea TaxID=3562 RepID=A0A9R0IGI7_SPIOL|nr:uncharacterized protein LOC110788557 isoform X2 [Spinacia oleracea]